MNGDTPAPQKPFVDPTDMRPEEWQGYLANARKALHANPKDAEALQAIRDANSALGVYDEAEAASPGERISAGVSEGAMGLSRLPSDILSLLTHPSQWPHAIRPTQEDVSGLASNLTGDDPAKIAETVANLGAAAVPFAKAGPAGSFRLGSPKGSTVGTVVGDIGQRLARRVAQTPKVAGALLERPLLTNELLRARIADLARKGQPSSPGAPPAMIPDAAPPEIPVHPDAARAMDDFAAGKISGAQLRYTMDVAARRTPNPADVAAIDAENAPSGVAPTVPVDQTPAPKPAPDPLDNPTFQRRAPPEGRTFPYYPRGGQAEQATSPGPVSSMPPIPTKIVEASRPLAQALGQVPESFEGGGFSGVAQALQHPAYQNAEILAGQAVRLGMPQFKGMSLPDATAALRTMIVQHVERGGEIPPITTVPKFLERLSSEGPR